jgi:hypothetical protein
MCTRPGYLIQILWMAQPLLCQSLANLPTVSSASFSTPILDTREHASVKTRRPEDSGHNDPWLPFTCHTLYFNSGSINSNDKAKDEKDDDDGNYHDGREHRLQAMPVFLSDDDTRGLQRQHRRGFPLFFKLTSKLTGNIR